MTKYCFECVVCGAGNGGSFSGHSRYVGPGRHVSTSRTCSVTKVHCVDCCTDPEAVRDLREAEEAEEVDG